MPNNPIREIQIKHLPAADVIVRGWFMSPASTRSTWSKSHALDAPSSIGAVFDTSDLVTAIFWPRSSAISAEATRLIVRSPAHRGTAPTHEFVAEPSTRAGIDPRASAVPPSPAP
ncbi:MAG TPA: hypothetical protein DCE44_20475 [Verrucomicrobiales bacterium]|nr:hypothetical protein [Verrucomicrobiales bacterium]